MSDKDEATRLADALESGTYLLSVERSATAALLRRWPDAGEPVGWRWQSPVGGWAYGKTVSPHAISGGFAVQPLYTSPTAESERIAALEAENAEWKAKAATWLASPEAARRLQGYRELTEHIAALEAALEQARVALEEMQYARTDKAERLTAEALRKIEEVRK